MRRTDKYYNKYYKSTDDQEDFHMVEFLYKPWSSVVIHEIIEYTPDELLTNLVRQNLASGATGNIPVANWANGIVFLIYPFPPNDEVTRDNLRGIIHYSAVQFASFPQYRQEVNVTIGTNQFPVRLQKSETNPIFVQLAEFIRQGN